MLEMHKVTRADYYLRTGRLPDDGERLEEFLGVPVGTELRCFHCGETFLLGDEKVDRRDGLLVCPKVSCDGNPLDWFPVE